MQLPTIDAQERAKLFTLDLDTAKAAVRPLRNPLTTIGHVLLRRSYARPKDSGIYEDWFGVCYRCVNFMYRVLKLHQISRGAPFNDEKAQRDALRALQLMYQGWWTPPGRGLWMADTDFVWLRSGAALNNCGFVSTADVTQGTFHEPFEWLMRMSTLGVGIGMDTDAAGKVLLTDYFEVNHGEVFFTKDSREGWAETFGLAIRSCLDGWQKSPQMYDLSDIRPAGSPIVTFGGVAPGPDPLGAALVDVLNLLSRGQAKARYDKHKKLVLVRQGSVARPLPIDQRMVKESDIVDVANIAGHCVVSGGVRRSAEILIGKQTENFMTVKRRQTPWGYVSNNTVRAEVGQNFDRIESEIREGYGDVGAFFLQNAQAFGRMKDPLNDIDFRVRGCNPCVEQSLEPWELCCLAELYPARTSLSGFKEAQKYAYLWAKAVSLVPVRDEPKTQEVIERNHRLGVSQTGVQQAFVRHGYGEMLQASDRGYSRITSLDMMYSAWLGVPPSIKRTSIKPSGSISLLFGATSGKHWAHAEHMVRRMTVEQSSPLHKSLEEAGYPNVQHPHTPGSSIFEFPYKYEHFSRKEADVPLQEQMNTAVALQHFWADNQVSATLKFSPNDDIAGILKRHAKDLKGISFLEKDNKKYENAPFEEISEAEYLERQSKLKDLNLTGVNHDTEDRFCEGDACIVS